MWTSNRRLDDRTTQQAAALGSVTLGGNPAGVYLGGERRWVEVYSPGGYQWCPAPGDSVLLLHAGDQREAPCLAAAKQPEPTKLPLAPGEVRIQGGTGEINLNGAGVDLSGTVSINGEEVQSMIRRIVAQMIGKGG